MLQTGLSYRPLAVLGLLPLSMLVLAFSFQIAHGPHWFYLNSDPDYFYLCDCLTLAQFKVPDCVLHPGTPVTVLGAVVIRVIHLFAWQLPLRDDVLTNPERYLFWMNAALLYPLVLLSWYGGWRIFKSSACYLPAFIFQLAPLLSFTVMDALATFKPEPMQIWASMLLGLWILLDLYHPVSGENVEDTTRTANQYAIGYGVLIGFGLAIKFTSIAYGMLPLLLLPFTQRAHFTYVLSTVASFLFFVLPALPRWKWFYNNIVLVSSHTGLYGAGDEAVLGKWAMYSANIKQLFQEEPWFAGVLGISMLAALAAVLVLKKLDPAQRKALRFLGALTAVQILHVIMTARHPAARYLVPSYALAGVNFVLIYQLLKGEKPWCGYAPQKAAFGLVVTVFAAWAVLQTSDKRGAELVDTQKRLEFCTKMDAEIKAGHVIFGHVASALPNAVHRGNFSYSRSRYTEEVGKAYPLAIFYHVPKGTFIKGTKDVTTDQLVELCKAQPMKILADPEWAALKCPPGFQLKEIDRVNDEGYFEIVAKP